MNILHWIDSLCGAAYRLRDDMRRRMIAAVIVLVGLLLIFAAAGFAVAASYMWLATEYPAHIAALLVACGLAVVAGITIALGLARNRAGNGQRRRGGIAGEMPDRPGIEHEVEEIADRAIREAQSQVVRNPMASVLTAVTLGVVVGLMGRRK
jgi:small-conductance mechanosensitive channel